MPIKIEVKEPGSDISECFSVRSTFHIETILRCPTCKREEKVSLTEIVEDSLGGMEITHIIIHK